MGASGSEAEQFDFGLIDTADSECKTIKIDEELTGLETVSYTHLTLPTIYSV